MSVSLPSSTVSSLSSNNSSYKTNHYQPEMMQVWVFRSSGKSDIDRVEAWLGSEGWEMLGIIHRSGEKGSEIHSVIEGLKVLQGAAHAPTAASPNQDLIKRAIEIIAGDSNPTQVLVVCNR